MSSEDMKVAAGKKTNMEGYNQLLKTLKYF